MEESECRKILCFSSTHGKGPNSEHKKNQKAYLALLNPNQRLEAVLQQQTDEEIQKNRLRLQASIHAVRWLTFQNCAFRGHDEGESSENRGNFIELIKYAAFYDKNLAKVVLHNAPGNASYTSSTIQKEILHIFGNKVRAEIREEIGEAKFCVLLDESEDRAQREQMAIVLRFVDKNGILKERFFDIIHVKNTEALTLKQELYKVLDQHSLSVKNIRGQGYDGASNMRGKFNGLKALLLNDNPYAYYIHCFAHRNQLALVASTREVIPIQQLFMKLGIIVNLVGGSSKRHDEFQAEQASIIASMIVDDEVETGRGLNQIGKLQRAGDTRWTSHLNSVLSLIRTYRAAGTVLKTIISHGNSTQRAEADATYDTLVSFEFVFVLHLMKNLLGKTDNLCQALQSKTQDIVNAMSLVSTTKVLLQSFRESGWDAFLMEVESFCEKNDIIVPDMTTSYTGGKGRSRRNENITLEHHYRVDLFLAATDAQLQEIQNRFNEQVMELLILSATLDPKNSFVSFNIKKVCDMVNKYYPDDFSEQEKCRFPFELEVFHLEVTQHSELKSTSCLSELCQRLVETGKATTCPLIYRLICLILTLPVSTASCERAFSAMSIVKTQLRSKMEDDFLQDLLVVYIEKIIAKEFSFDSIIDEFARMKVRKVRFK